MEKIEELKKEQEKLSKKIIIKDCFDKIEKIAAFGRAFFDDKILITIIVVDRKSLKILESKYIISDLKFPYISGLLAYRESPFFIEAYNLIKIEPDLILVPAHGIIHPRKLGMASHIGLLLNKPTIGIAKNLICGENKNGKIYIGNELLGLELKTKEFSNSIYVSVGNKITLKTAADLINKMIKPPHKMPEPLHEANKLAKKIKNKLK